MTKVLFYAFSSRGAFVKVREFFQDYRNIRQQGSQSGKSFPFLKLRPCLQDKHAQSGNASGHYFHQDLLAARRIYENKPIKHVDIGSRIDGFVAHVAAFREIEVLDIRPVEISHNTIKFRQADIMSDNFPLIDYCDSVSCLHALEHLGLGRYGDPIDYNGYLQGITNLTRLLKTGGKLYLSVPIGPQRIEFNAHRVFSLRYLLELMQTSFNLDRFSYVNDKGDLYENISLTEDIISSNAGCKYGCGILEMTKKI